ERKAVIEKGVQGFQEIVKQSPFKNVEDCLDNVWTAAGVRASRVNKCCTLIKYQGDNVWRKTGEAQNPSCLRACVPKEEMISRSMSTVVFVYRVLSSPKSAQLATRKHFQNFQQILVHMLPSADNLYGPLYYWA
ncbi:hypothetical protein AMECASPLE_012267, partial [Ameca splendens]